MNRCYIMKCDVLLNKTMTFTIIFSKKLVYSLIISDNARQKIDTLQYKLFKFNMLL